MEEGVSTVVDTKVAGNDGEEEEETEGGKLPPDLWKLAERKPGI